MILRDYLQTASVRQYAMIGGSIVATFLYIWIIFLIQHFLDGKIYPPAQFFDLTKFQLQTLAYFGYIAGFAMILFVVALTVTKFNVTTKLGSATVGRDDEDHQVAAKVTTTTTVENPNG